MCWRILSDSLFSQEESEDIKRKIRDILTSAYEQRLQKCFFLLQN